MAFRRASASPRVISACFCASETISTWVLSACALIFCAASSPLAISSAASRSRSARILAKVASRFWFGRSVRFSLTSMIDTPRFSASIFAVSLMLFINAALSAERTVLEATEPSTCLVAALRIRSSRLSADRTPPTPTASLNLMTSKIR